MGLAWSGGGLTGFMASMCATVALRELSPPGEMWNSLNYSLAVNSGGTLGSILMDSVPPGRLRFPPSWDPSSYTYSQMASKFEVGHHRPGSVWFGAVNGLIPSSVPSTDVRGGGANHGWWVDALGVALGAYGLTAPELSAGARPIGAGVSLLRQAAAPIIRDEASGTMHDALGNLIAAEVDLRSGRLEAVGEPARGGGRPFPAVSNVSVLGGGAMSSAFWGAAIVELPRGLEWDASKAALIALPGEAQAAEGGGTRLAGGSSQAETGWYAMDGGVVDTSGIAALLRRRVKRIVAFENKNSDLRQINATYAFLFGVDTPTDTMNSLQGPALAQVFPAELYPAVIANLTDGEPTGRPAQPTKTSRPADKTPPRLDRLRAARAPDRRARARESLLGHCGAFRTDTQLRNSAIACAVVARLNCWTAGAQP